MLILLLIVTLQAISLICSKIYEYNPFYHNAKLPIAGKAIDFISDVFCISFVIIYGFPRFFSINEIIAATGCSNKSFVVMISDCHAIFFIINTVIFVLLVYLVKIFVYLIKWINWLRRPNYYRRQYIYIGDSHCVNNARSKYLRCAINPSGDCGNCKDRKIFDADERAAEQIAEARDWIALHCWRQDRSTLAELTDIEVIRGIDRHYQGGWSGFCRDVDNSHSQG